ncbi:unnamed protein product, partial [Rotaria sp. Silwood1]
MLHSQDIEESNNDNDVEIDDDELGENVDIFAGPDRNLKLPLEQEVSENRIQLAIEEFERNFAEVYPSAGPALFIGSLNEAINHSLFDPVDRRPLLLYLHRNRTPSTHVFCKNILCNSEIIDYIDKNYLFWAWDCTRDANYQRFLLMLLEHVGPKVTAMMVKIPIDDYPQLICILYEQGQINAIKVISHPDDSSS